MKKIFTIMMAGLMLLSANAFAICVSRTITADRVELKRVFITMDASVMRDFESQGFNKTATRSGCGATKSVAVRRARKNAAKAAANLTHDHAIRNYGVLMVELCNRHSLDLIRTSDVTGSLLRATAYTGLSRPSSVTPRGTSFGPMVHFCG